MFPRMRRHKQTLPLDECVAILENGEYGVLGTAGTDGYPYAVPISYAFRGGIDEQSNAIQGRIYLHCATSGHKLDALADNAHVSFTVVGHSAVAPEQLTALYQSVIAFGTARQPASADEAREALVALGQKYCPGLDDFVHAEIEKLRKSTGVIIIDLEQVTGKEAIELTRERSK